MNLRDLEYVVAVAELLHYGKAAERCHVSQPTLSMQLKKLEEYLGTPLFERSNKHVLPTAAGEKITAHARGILQSAQEMKEIARMAQDPYAGEFRLGAFPTLAPYFLPLAVPLIAKELPKLKLLLTEEKTAELLEHIKTGILDAAFVALPVHDDMLESAAIFDDPFLLAVPQKHAFAKRTSILQDDIKGERLLLLEDGHCLRNQALEVCSLVGASEYQDFRATSLETLRQMVAAGVGITLIPKIAMRKKDGIIYIPFAENSVSRKIGLIWRATSVRKPCITRLLKLVARTIN